MHSQQVDATPTSALALCSCGWRHITTHRQAARRAAHAHALTMHRGDNDPSSSRSGRRYA